MAIPPGHVENLKTLIRAARNGDLAIVECTERASGEPAHVICAISHIDEQYEIAPLARLFDTNPYELLDPPRAEQSPAPTR